MTPPLSATRQFAKMYHLIKKHVEDERAKHEIAVTRAKAAKRRSRYLTLFVLAMLLVVAGNVFATGYLSRGLVEAAKEVRVDKARGNSSGAADDTEPTAGARLKSNDGDVLATREAMSKLPSS